MKLTERLKLKDEIRKEQRRIDSLLMQREAIDLQLDLGASVLEGKRTLLALVEPTEIAPLPINFMSISEG